MMICSKCGAENKDDALFCKKCGAPFDTGNNMETHAESGKKPSVIEGFSVERISDFVKKNKKMSAAAVLVVLFLVILAFASSSPVVVNMNDYLVFSTDGYDGLATVAVYVDWDSLENAYKEKIKLSGKGKKALKEAEVDLDEINTIDYLKEAVYPEADKTSGLSNGTEISYSWNVDEEIIEYVNCKVKCTDGSYRVEGLEKVEYFDAFKDLKVEFYGISPFMKADVEYNGTEFDINDFIWGETEGLKRGDVFTVTLDSEKAEDFQNRTGKVLKETEREYLIEGDYGYLYQLSELKEEDLNKIKEEAIDSIIRDYASVDGVMKVEDLKYCGEMLLFDENENSNEVIHPDSPDGLHPYNDLVLVFRYISSVNDVVYSDYAYIFYDNWNITLDKDGNVDFIMLTEKNSALPDESWDEAYNSSSYVHMLEKDILSIRVEKNIDTEGTPCMKYSESPDGGAPDSEDDTGKAVNNTYIFPQSDRDLLEEADLDKLSKEECSLARNEIYARHGRKFKDENIQGYFDSCTWYKGEVEPDDFDENSLNVFEKANRDLISKYEKEKGYR